jgi:sugar transferase (PEP-CTERM/EpsH1 system associated)
MAICGKPLNILYIAHRIPYPPNKGEKIRAFHQIRGLSDKHRVHLACLVDDREDLQYADALGKYCASVDMAYRDGVRSLLLMAAAMATGTPLSVAAFRSRDLSRKIKQRLASEKIDRILVSSSAMAEYVRHVPVIPKVVDFVDVDSDKWRLYAEHHSFPRSWIYRAEAGRLARYEERVARVVDSVTVVSEKEANLLRMRLGDRKISVIPNGVDLDYFSGNGDGDERFDEPAIVFAGVMDYFPNIDAVEYFCDAIFPKVRRVRPETMFFIVGRQPTRKVRALARRENVVVTGSVADVRPYLAQSSVAVAPFRIARGIQNKVLEAMAMQRPVVGTSQAFQGIQATREDGVWMEDSVDGFVHAVLTFLEDPNLRREQGLRARRYVERHHQWRDYGVQLERLLEKIG